MFRGHALIPLTRFWLRPSWNLTILTTYWCFRVIFAIFPSCTSTLCSTFCLSSLEKHLIIYRIVRDTIVPWMHQQEALGNGTFDRMMLMHDGAPIHRAQVVTQWLEANVTLMCSQPCQQDVRIGRSPFILSWPPYSADLTPMDFCKFHFDHFGKKKKSNIVNSILADLVFFFQKNRFTGYSKALFIL